MLLNAESVSEKILKETKEDVKKLKENGRAPVLALLRTGDDPGKISYEKSIFKRLEPLGIKVQAKTLDPDISEKDFLKELSTLNGDSGVDAILVLKPLPGQVDERAVDNMILPGKDPDASSPENLGKLIVGDDDGFIPCTAEGIMELLDYYNIDVKGKDVVIVNNSAVLGKPLAMLLTNRFATVTLCHIYTKDLAKHTREADILITGAGVYGLIKPEMVKDGAIVIDAAITRKKDADGNPVKDQAGKTVRAGDVLESVLDKAKAITSATPGLGGGTGPITTALLARHIVQAANRQKER